MYKPDKWKWLTREPEGNPFTCMHGSSERIEEKMETKRKKTKKCKKQNKKNAKEKTKDIYNMLRYLLGK